MRTLNCLKLISLLGATFLSIKNVKATIPKCVKGDDNADTVPSGYNYCDLDGLIKFFDNDQLINESNVVCTSEGLHFIQNSSNLSALEENPKAAILLNLTISEEGECSYNELQIKEGFYDVGEDNLIYCDKNQKCNTYSSTPVTDPVYYISYDGNLIKQEESAFSNSDKKDGYYVNGNKGKQLIKCESSTCTEVAAQDGDAYVDVETEQIIICSNGDNGVKCEYKDDIDGYIINSSAITSSVNPIINCESGSCKESPVPDPYSYYEYALDNTKVIACSSVKNTCKLESGEVGDYFVAIQGDEKNKLIKCSNENDKVVCKVGTAENGYYLNSGGNSSVNQTIYCDSGSCDTIHVNPGYYINSGSIDDEQKDGLIQCDLNICDTKDISVIDCSKLSSISYATVCYKDSAFNFYKSDDLINPTNFTTAGEVFIFDSLKRFPSIGSEVTTLYHLTEYGIERYIGSGVIGVKSSTNQKVSDLDGELGSEIILYDCSTTTKQCTRRTSCVSNTYMYDIENKAALYCNNGKLVSETGKGYYVDSVTMVGSKTPYIINCDENECTHEAPTVQSYYINSSEYDGNSKKLIYCNNSNCYTVAATSGYYISNQQNGIISCTSSTACTYRDAATAGNNVNYVNAGKNKSLNALIYCNGKTCVPKTAKVGYYFSNRVTTLIYCESTNSCNEINPTENYYNYADTIDGKNYIIKCSKVSTSIICSKEVPDTGSYLTSQTNILINCTKNGSCKQINAKPGFYQSAVKITINSKRDVDNEKELVKDISGRDSTTTYNIIECTTTNCELLSAEELASIPICEYNSDKCYITLNYAMSKSAVTSISAGNICTNSDRSKIYFATDTIVVAPSVIAGQTATYVYTTTTTNCLIADSKYDDYYYTIGSDIYRINDGSISHFYDTGYYFIDIEKNALVSSNNIDNYNKENVKLYKCDGLNCVIIDEPDNATYFSDVNKRIVKYNINSNSYVFAYEKDIICIFANNKCTPNADLNNREFCITYKGEIALAAADIKNRETGDCYKASSINSKIYGYNQYLYNMDIGSATVVDKNGYYIVSLSSNSTVVTKDYKNRMVNTNSFKVYGCYNTNCKVYTPESGLYYYDDNSKTLLKNEDNTWVAPSNSGYALVSINPNEKYVYKFKIENDVVTLISKAGTGYYYTIDNEMYECSENDNSCKLIEDSDYYFTNAGEIYYCVYDSENLEKTECTKQSCYAGQNYYIGDNYYRCEAGSYLTPIKSRNCKYDENVIVNFPVILKEEFPTTIKQAIESVERNNNSTAVAVRSNKKYLTVIPAIFTNCTYNVEETEAAYDFVCLNNYVTVNEEEDTVEICSIENLGYVECIEDDANPEKCKPSSAFTRVVLNVFSVIFIAIYIIVIIFNI